MQNKGCELLAKWRAYEKKTRAETAQFLEISVSMVTQLENGSSRPGLELAVDIEKKTGGYVSATSWLTP
jgi:DNA-binding XRE family transcriptional regulator